MCIDMICCFDTGDIAYMHLLTVCSVAHSLGVGVNIDQYLYCETQVIKSCAVQCS